MVQFGRDIYWPDNYTEVQTFMPEYRYVNPEDEVLQSLKAKIEEE